MNKDELIVKQQLEIETIKESLNEYNEAMMNIHGLLFNIGEPLNDNKLMFNYVQKVHLNKIAKNIIYLTYEN